MLSKRHWKRNEKEKRTSDRCDTKNILYRKAWVSPNVWLCVVLSRMFFCLCFFIKSACLDGVFWLFAGRYCVQGVYVIAEVKYAYCVIYDWVEMEKTRRPLLPFHQVQCRAVHFLATYGERSCMCLVLEIVLLLEKHGCCCFLLHCNILESELVYN